MATTMAATNRSVTERDKLILDNRGLVHAVARRTYFTNRLGKKGIELDDMIGIGMIALIKSAQYFDPDNVANAKFATYATSSIRREIWRAVLNSSNVIKLPDKVVPWGPRRNELEARQRGNFDVQSQGLESQVRDLGEQFDRQAEAAAVQAALAHIELMQPRTAKALRLRYFEGMRLGAIEKELGGLSKRRIRQILEMGLEALGDILD